MNNKSLLFQCLLCKFQKILKETCMVMGFCSYCPRDCQETGANKNFETGKGNEKAFILMKLVEFLCQFLSLS